MDNPTFLVEEASVLRMIMEYLRKRGYYEAVSALYLETGLSEIELGPEVSYLQRLVLSGRWDDVLLFVGPLRQLAVDFEKIEYLVHKQQYLEAISWHGGGGAKHSLLPWYPRAGPNTDDEVDVEVLVGLLKSLEKHCNSTEFSQLCQCLTLNRLCDCPAFANWSVTQGRLQTFLQLTEILDPLLKFLSQNAEINTSDHADRSERKKWIAQAIARITNADIRNPIPTSSSGLLATLAMSIAYQKESSIEYSDMAPDTAPPMCGLSQYCVAVPGIDLSDVVATAPTILLSNPICNVLYTESINEARIAATPAKPSSITDTSNQIDQKPQPSGGAHTFDLPVSAAPSTNARAMPEPLSEPKVIKKPKPVAWTVEVNAPANGERQVPGAIGRQSGNMSSGGVNANSGAGVQILPRPSQDHGRQISSAAAKVVSPGAAAHNSQQTATKPELLAQKQMGTQPRHLKTETEITKTSLTAMELAARERELELQEIQHTEKERSYLQRFQMQQQQQQYRIQPSPAKLKTPTSTVPNYPLDNSVKDVDDNMSAFSHGTSHAPSLDSRSSRQTGQSSKPKVAPATASRHQEIQDTSLMDPIAVAPSLVYQANCPLRSVVGLYAPLARSWTCSALAIGSNAKAVHIVSVPTGTGSQIQSLHDFENVHNGSIYAMDWSWKHNLVCSGSNDKTIRLINARDNIISSPLKGHNGTIRVVKMQGGSNFGFDNNALLASAGAGDCKVRIWDIQSGNLLTMLAPHPDAVHGLAWLDDNTLVSGCDKGIITLHDIRTNTSVSSVSLASNPIVNRSAVGICCIERLCGLGPAATIAAGCTDGLLSIVNLRSMSVVSAEVLHKEDIRSIVSTVTVGDKDTCSLESARLTTTSYDSTGAIWSLQMTQSKDSLQFRKLGQLQGHDGKVLAVAGVPGTTKLLTSGADGRVFAWDHAVFGRF